ncbi:MAG: aspartate-semialdehyde dehydrogenase [Spirochaetaceae bacterium]|nr:MAG: aspartate-semialdehyde dehydrogenase [Spirochaetaceae bacterium]
MKRIPVAVLGATGTVGQKFAVLLQSHPLFEIEELVASPRSAGRSYAEVCAWKQDQPMPQQLRSMIVKTTEESLHSSILFSGLDSSVAGTAETNYAEKGHFVISNSKNHRMDADVPLVIPEVNSDHFALIERQPYAGAIITNSNCSTMFLAMALAPLHRAFEVVAVNVTTMQAISGAGYPGVASMDILGNVIPYIGDEEEKLETETARILGTLGPGGVEPAPFAVSAQCTRVPVFDGHTESVSIRFRETVTPERVAETLRAFRGPPQELGLHSAPEAPIVVTEQIDRPQPARDIWQGSGMVTVVGRIRRCPVLDIKMILLGHNTVRGAAGAAILNAETLLAMGHIPA